MKEQVSFPQTRFLHWFEPFRVDLDDNFKACCHFKVYWKKKIILHWLLTIYIGSQLTSLELVWHPHCWMQHALAGDTLIAKHKQYLITNMSRSLTTVWSLFRRDCKLTFHYTTLFPCFQDWYLDWKIENSIGIGLLVSQITFHSIYPTKAHTQWIPW